MDEREKKLEVLCRIAHSLNRGKVLWALGGSLLLYLKGKTDTFHDIDLMVGRGMRRRPRGGFQPWENSCPKNPRRATRPGVFWNM